MNRKRRKKIRIIYEARDPKDAMRIFEKLKEAAEGANPTSQGATAEPVTKYRITSECEQLETKVNDAASARADELARNSVKRNEAAGLPPDHAECEPVGIIEEKRRRVVGFFMNLAGLGYRATIKVAADLIKETLGLGS